MKMTKNVDVAVKIEAQMVGAPVLTPNLERMKLWADELINGDREQGEGNLRRGDEYCCLGVAIEVAMANGCEVIASEDSEGTWSYDGIRDFLPPSVSAWYGVIHNPVVSKDSHDSEVECGRSECGCPDVVSATDANDERNWTFREIGTGIKQFYGLGD